MKLCPFCGHHWYDHIPDYGCYTATVNGSECDCPYWLHGNCPYWLDDNCSRKEQP